MSDWFNNLIVNSGSFMLSSPRPCIGERNEHELWLWLSRWLRPGNVHRQRHCRCGRFRVHDHCGRRIERNRRNQFLGGRRDGGSCQPDAFRRRIERGAGNLCGRKHDLCSDIHSVERSNRRVIGFPCRGAVLQPKLHQFFRFHFSQPGRCSRHCTDHLDGGADFGRCMDCDSGAWRRAGLRHHGKRQSGSGNIATAATAAAVTTNTNTGTTTPQYFLGYIGNTIDIPGGDFTVPGSTALAG